MGVCGDGSAAGGYATHGRRPRSRGRVEARYATHGRGRRPGTRRMAGGRCEGETGPPPQIRRLGSGLAFKTVQYRGAGLRARLPPDWTGTSPGQIGQAQLGLALGRQGQIGPDWGQIGQAQLWVGAIGRQRSDWTGTSLSRHEVGSSWQSSRTNRPQPAAAAWTGTYRSGQAHTDPGTYRSHTDPIPILDRHIPNRRSAPGRQRSAKFSD
jgi:hypothetical protein